MTEQEFYERLSGVANRLAKIVRTYDVPTGNDEEPTDIGAAIYKLEQALEHVEIAMNTMSMRRH